MKLLVFFAKLCQEALYKSFKAASKAESKILILTIDIDKGAD